MNQLKSLRGNSIVIIRNNLITENRWYLQEIEPLTNYDFLQDDLQFMN